MMRPEPESSPEPYSTATSLENVLQQPEDVTITRSSVEPKSLPDPTNLDPESRGEEDEEEEQELEKVEEERRTQIQIHRRRQGKERP
jgi:hypothetical protein